MLRFTIAFSLAAIPISVATPASAQYGGGGLRQIKCESWNYKPAQCPVELRRRADVDVVQVLGGNCVEGRTWDWDRQGIRVSGGCRAIFAISGGGGGGGGGRDTVACESFKYRYQTCALPGRGRPDLVRVIAGQCVEGQSWGGRGGEVWVDKGCRALFASSRGGGGGGFPGPGGGGAQLITCESWNYKYAECATQARRIELDSVIAGQCQQGVGWGIAPRGVWVNRGCRARFRTFG
jgi:hypothetical protein